MGQSKPRRGMLIKADVIREVVIGLVLDTSGKGMLLRVDGRECLFMWDEVRSWSRI